MGGFLANTFVRATETDRVLMALKRVLRARTAAKQASQRGLLALGGEGLAALWTTMEQIAEAHPVAFVAPPENGWIGIFTTDSDYERLPEALSAELQTIAIGFSVYDDDFMCYHLTRDGQVLDRFNSRPDYFTGELEMDEPEEDSEPIEIAQLRERLGMPAPELLAGSATILAEACGLTTQIERIDEVLHKEPGWSAFAHLEELTALLQIPNAVISYNLLDEPQVEIPNRDRYLAVMPADLRADGPADK